MARLTARVFSAHDFSNWHYSLEAYFVMVNANGKLTFGFPHFSSETE